MTPTNCPKCGDAVMVLYSKNMFKCYSSPTCEWLTRIFKTNPDKTKALIQTTR